MAAGGGAARRCWRSGTGLARAVRGVCGSGRATAALRAEELAERLRKSDEQQREVSGVRAAGPAMSGLQVPACTARVGTGSGTRGEGSDGMGENPSSSTPARGRDTFP